MGDLVVLKEIFISGPSDTYEEMELIKCVIESINKVVCPPNKIRLEWKTGATHTRAGTGRPQEKINPQVKDCDLFIGVFNKRFGSKTGKFKSGSEEEFKIALDKNIKSKSGNDEIIRPEIFLFFKDIEQNEMNDIGPQLKRLLEFQKDIREHIMYTQYINNNELIFSCYEQIIQWINSIIQKDEYYLTYIKKVMK